MSKNLLRLVVFLAGLVAIGWIGAGYLTSNPLGLVVTAVIAACYIAGARELQRYRQATATLDLALADITPAQSDLGAWLARLHPSLRNAVQLRVEGERVALPAPSMTPYLVGLLVLLGMLGTLLGMMATLRGTGLALESATDLEAIRGSLGAPVKGLAFAFGTSIAGVAGSAMLGLLSALCRRERVQAVQQLDVQLASTLRPYSHAHQREEAFRLLQQQTGLMPTLIERLQTMMTTLEQHNHNAAERLASSQQEFHQRAEASHLQLATSLQQSLTTGMAESAKTVGSALQPVVEATLAGLGRETAAMQASVSSAVQQQLDGLAGNLQATTRAAADTWNAATTQQQQSNEMLAQDFRDSLQQFSDTFAQRSESLLASVSAHLDDSTATAARGWSQTLSQQQALNEQLAARNEQALGNAALGFEQRASALLDVMQRSHAGLQETLESRDQQRLAQWADSFATMTAALHQQWERSGEQIASRQQEICDTLVRSAGEVARQVQGNAADTIAGISRHAQQLVSAAEGFDARTGNLLDAMQQSHGDLQAALEARDQQRLAQWSEALSSISTTLSRNWQLSSDHVASRQQDICDTLAKTAEQMSAQSQAHARDTIAEISRLVQSASEAPRAAAEVVAELRQKLSDSMVRDTAMLEERGRLLSTLETLLDAVNHASTDQRTAVDALVSTSADLLERVGNRFSVQIETEAGKLDDAAAHVTSSAVEMASLGEAFGTAVQLFGSSTEALNERLQVIESALEKSLTRSDEQLAYYVAQAREVVELSMLSQKQIIAELQQLGDRRNAPGTQAG
ncbi:DUF802 domain-containing protein [Stenotrophomonas sp. YIM B06876]|uniref:DUF802 domain-containing protein n=1 Tax=Stenotrophomonas sp. YIM B06876 TaxID=3060211 RepID=UPI0027392BB6|nr:DUF802 domain-containing protein [Stenotrophomonas sp. YIM B06876]